MKSKHNKKIKNKKSKTKKNKKSKGWRTAIDAAQNTLKKTGSLSKAKTVLRLQAYQNARKLFGSIGERR